MYQVTKEIYFCYGHRLLNYSGKCKNLHGHNGKAVIELSAQKLDERGMVVDFGDIKRELQTWIDENWDHRLILNEKDPLIPALQAGAQPFYTLPVNPTAENITKTLFDIAKQKNLPVTRITIWETENSFATYY